MEGGTSRPVSAEDTAEIYIHSSVLSTINDIAAAPPMKNYACKSNKITRKPTIKIQHIM